MLKHNGETGPHSKQHVRVLQHVAIQESRNKRNQAPSAPDVRAQRILGNPRGQGGAAETTYHSIRTINSIHINFCYKSYKGGCFWVFRSTFYFKAVYSVFINCLEKKKEGIAMSGNYKELKKCTTSETPFIPHLFLMQSWCVSCHHRVCSRFGKLVVISPCTSAHESWLWGNIKKPGNLS